MTQRVVIVGATGQIGRPLSAGHHAWLPVPAPFVRMGLGVVTDILVRGKRVIPARVTALGYRFVFPGLDAALGDLVGHRVNETAGVR